MCPPPPRPPGPQAMAGGSGALAGICPAPWCKYCPLVYFSLSTWPRLTSHISSFVGKSQRGPRAHGGRSESRRRVAGPSLL